MTTSTLPTILVVDGDVLIGRSLKRLAELSFPDFQVLWAKNGVVGVELARLHAASLRLIVLDVNMPLLDGNLFAAQVRALVPQVPVMPFISHQEMLPALLELGCLLPVLKHPAVMSEMPERIRQAMSTPVPPLPNSTLVVALQQSGDAVLTFVREVSGGRMFAAEQGATANVERALALLDRYCGRFQNPAREVLLARRLLRGDTVS